MAAGNASAFVFDLDDTLFPERDYVLSGFRAAAHEFAAATGNPADEDVFFNNAKLRFDAGERGYIFDAVAPNKNFIPRLIAAYRAHAPALQLDPSIADLLRALRARGHKLAILTDGFLAVQQAKVAALNLAPLVDAVVYSDTWGRSEWKPALRPFRAVEQQLNAPPADCIYIGDNPSKDFLGARNAGWHSIRLRLPNREHSAAEPASALAAPDFTVTSIPELQRALLAPIPTRTPSSTATTR